MQAAPNIDELRTLDQTELATRYCVVMAGSMMRELAARRAPAAAADADDDAGAERSEPVQRLPSGERFEVGLESLGAFEVGDKNRER